MTFAWGYKKKRDTQKEQDSEIKKYWGSVKGRVSAGRISKLKVNNWHDDENKNKLWFI